MRIIWIGHSCFKFISENSSIIIDPYNSVPGLSPISETANGILVTHNHSDHNAIQRITTVEKQTDFIYEKIDLWHDKSGGSLRGENHGYIISDSKFRVAHLGDIGCRLSSEQVQKLKDLDVLMIPVGGTYTITGDEAAEIVCSLKPRIVIPMHYKDTNRVFGFEKLEGLEKFIGNMDKVKILNQSEVNLESFSFRMQKLMKKRTTTVLILRPQNAEG